MTPNGQIPFLDLVSPHMEIQDELVEIFKSALRTASFIGGPAVENFEKEFAQFCESPYSIAVSSGTDALRFALMAAGIQNGDIALTVPLTFIATCEGISQAGARPDFVDADPRTYTMDPEKVMEYFERNCVLNPSTGQMIHRTLQRPVTALVPVHLYGQMADMDRLMEIAARFKLIVVEDACQAHGAEYFSQKNGRWHKAGSMGDAAAFSFYPGKNLGACGEGGAVTTASLKITQMVRMLRDHGQSKKYHHEVEGYNGRLDSIQAGILSVKLRRLAGWNKKRRDAAEVYQRLLVPMQGPVTLPFEPATSKAVYHLYVILCPERDRLIDHCQQAGIGTGIHYPIPVHVQKPYAYLGYTAGDFPISEKVAANAVSLPMHTHLTPEQQQRVVETIQTFPFLAPLVSHTA